MYPEIDPERYRMRTTWGFFRCLKLICFGKKYHEISQSNDNLFVFERIGYLYKATLYIVKHGPLFSLRPWWLEMKQPKHFRCRLLKDHYQFMKDWRKQEQTKAEFLNPLKVKNEKPRKRQRSS